MICKFCGKICKNTNSLRNHERLCKVNPDRQYTYFSNLENQKKLVELKQNSKRKNQWSLPDYKISDETRKKLSEVARIRNLNELPEINEKRKKTINEKVKRGEWHTSLAKNMHYKYKGVDLHGKWELGYAKWLDHNGIKWRRPKESFVYSFDNKERRYTPDFYLEDEDLYIEIKGYETDKDIEKWIQFPKKLKILKEADLKKLDII